MMISVSKGCEHDHSLQSTRILNMPDLGLTPIGKSGCSSRFCYLFSTHDDIASEEARYSFSDIDYGSYENLCEVSKQTVKVNAASSVVKATHPGKYVVAWFHTHPPYQCTDKKRTRPVGPSTDEDFTIGGVVYDYMGENGKLKAGHEISDPAKVFHYGKEREPAYK
ncbi:hypothetical protein [Bacteroides sp. 224]|uniref:hypothetical protein n=1 Tax=Bacteroides sp. 224 TaxID=2302936 RepID=UPI0013D1D6AA|nr:hypothetical protein [Bacteroides sp. 224]NDV64575.1 hypothetical protein [Bacteroides sp. 224]